MFKVLRLKGTWTSMFEHMLSSDHAKDSYIFHDYVCKFRTECTEHLKPCGSKSLLSVPSFGSKGVDLSIPRTETETEARLLHTVSVCHRFPSIQISQVCKTKWKLRFQKGGENSHTANTNSYSKHSQQDLGVFHFSGMTLASAMPFMSMCSVPPWVWDCTGTLSLHIEPNQGQMWELRKSLLHRAKWSPNCKSLPHAINLPCSSLSSVHTWETLSTSLLGLRVLRGGM